MLFLLAVVLIALIVWGVPKMIEVNNKIARGDRTFFSDIVRIVFGKERR